MNLAFILIVYISNPLGFVYEIPVDKVAHAGVGILATQLCTRSIQVMQYHSLKKKYRFQTSLYDDQSKKLPSPDIGTIIWCSLASSALSLAKEQLDNLHRNNGGSDADWVAGSIGAAIGGIIIFEW